MNTNREINEKDLENELEEKQKQVQKLRFCIMSCCKHQLSKDYLKVFSL